MTELSQPKTGIWRERLWFVARLFAAGAVIGLAFQLIQILGLPFMLQLEFSDQWSPWQQTAFLYFGYGFVYFFGGFFAISFFRESWLRVCVGIVLVVTILSLFSSGISLASHWVRSLLPDFIDFDPGYLEIWRTYTGPAIISFLVISGLFSVAGGALRRIVVPPNTSTLPDSRLSKFVQLFAIFAAASGFTTFALGTMDQTFGFSQLLGGLGDYFLMIGSNLIEGLAAFALLYFVAGRLQGDRLKIAGGVLAVGLAYLVLREGLNAFVSPIYNNFIIGTSPAVSSVFPSLPTDQTAFQAWSGTAWSYAVNNSFPALLRDFLITLIAVSGIVLRRFLPPKQIPILIGRLRGRS